jgi:hypothetical protein
MDKITTISYDFIVHTFGMIGFFLVFCINAYLAFHAKQIILSVYLTISCIGFLSMTIYHIHSLFVPRHVNLPSSGLFTTLRSEKLDTRISLSSQITVCYRFFAHVCLTLFFCLMVLHTISSGNMYHDIINFFLSFISHGYFTVKLLLGLQDTPGAVGIILAQLDRVLLVFDSPSVKHFVMSLSAVCLIIMYSLIIFSEM